MVATGGLDPEGTEVNQEKFVRCKGLVRFERRDVGSEAFKYGRRLYENQIPSDAEEWVVTTDLRCVYNKCVLRMLK